MSFTHGSISLVAWDRVRHGKAQGGLGIKDLGLHNSCLLVKLLHTLFAGKDSSWALWARQHVNMHGVIGRGPARAPLGSAQGTAPTLSCHHHCFYWQIWK